MGEAYGPIPMGGEVVLKATPAQRWPLISNTDRLNRALGLTEMTVGEVAEDLSKAVTTRRWGITLAWRERLMAFSPRAALRRS